MSAQRVMYVASWSRSGSTLLDLMLGQIPGFVSVGELRFLWERGVREGQLCGCGAPVPKCPFWSRVLEEVFGTGLVRTTGDVFFQGEVFAGLSFRF